MTPMKAVDHLGPLIRKRRLGYALTHEQACNRALEYGVSLPPDHLEEIEAKQRRVPAGIMFGMLDALGVTLYEIEEELRQVENEIG